MSTPTARQTFRETVALVAEKAKARLPQAVNGRIESAARLVINGDVEPLDDGSIKVGGSDPTRWYHLVGLTCTCTDFTQGKAPEGWCKHRIAAGIHKRVGEVLPQAPPVETQPAPSAPLPEAPCSVNVRLSIDGRDCQLTLRDSEEARLLQRLLAVLAQYPVQAAGSSQAPPQSQELGWCARHGLQMTQTTKNGRSWYSHRTDDGWCKGR